MFAEKSLHQLFLNSFVLCIFFFKVKWKRKKSKEIENNCFDYLLVCSKALQDRVVKQRLITSNDSGLGGSAAAHSLSGVS